MGKSEIYLFFETIAALGFRFQSWLNHSIELYSIQFLDVLILTLLCVQFI